MGIGSVLNVLIVFGTFFGIIYLAIAARTRVRLALIEKGADASIFVSNHSMKQSSIFPLILVNLALLLVFSGIGIFTGALLRTLLGVQETVAYLGSILTLAGLGLFIGYKISSKAMQAES